MMNDSKELMCALGYTFSSASLLEQALTHPSFGARNNQRLEFLGDSVLQLVISRRLFLTYTAQHEGALTRLRQQLVCEQALAKAARTLLLGQYLKMDKGCEQAGGREQDSVLADAMEAVLAAIYLEGGYDAAEKVVNKLIKNPADQKADPKSTLQEYLQGRKMETPTYETLLEEGPAHARIFTVAVFVNGKQIAHGREYSKKKAEQAAAQQALAIFKNRFEGASCD